MNVNCHFEPLSTGMKARFVTRYRASTNYESNLCSTIIMPLPNKFSVSHSLITGRKGSGIFAKVANSHVKPY